MKESKELKKYSKMS